MSYMDELHYQTLLLIEAAHRHDEEDGAEVATAAYERAWDSDVDPIHIAMNIALLMTEWMTEDMVQRMLPLAAAAAAANFPDQGELLYPSPRGKIRKPRNR